MTQPWREINAHSFAVSKNSVRSLISSITAATAVLTGRPLLLKIYFIKDTQPGGREFPYLTVLLREKNISNETRVTSPIFRRPWWRVSGWTRMQQVLHFRVKISTSIMWSLEMMTFLSVCSLWRLLARGGNGLWHSGQHDTAVLKDRGYFSCKSSVSAASLRDILSRIDLSGRS